MNHSFSILILEDDPNDVLLLKRALRKNNIDNPVHILSDGEEGIAYLGAQGKYQDRETYPFPEVIILDLKMPKRGGLEVLQWLSDHPEHQVIPTLILTSSSESKDVDSAYKLGANSYFVKPSNFDELCRIIGMVFEYWKTATKPRRLPPAA